MPSFDQRKQQVTNQFNVAGDLHISTPQDSPPQAAEPQTQRQERTNTSAGQTGGGQTEMQPQEASRPEPTEFRYDVFLSYRRQDPDHAFAYELVQRLEADGYKVAIDECDFRANIPFLEEMERCVKESRFTLAVVSPRYLESGNTQKEVRIRTVLDMSGRTYSLIPLILEKVELPTWLYELTGIDWNSPGSRVDPYQKLKETLGNPR
jgi:hypothetical protein